MPTTVDRLFEESAMSFAELVTQTGFSRERAEAIVSGRWLPSPEERRVIAGVFDVTVTEVDWGHTMNPRNVRYHRFGLAEDFRTTD